MKKLFLFLLVGVFPVLANAFTIPPCFATPELMMAAKGKPGYPQLWKSPTGSGGAIVAACKEGGVWKGYEFHWTAGYLTSPTGTSEKNKVFGRFLKDPNAFWTTYDGAQSCKQIGVTGTDDAQLKTLCAELNALMNKYVSVLK